MKHIPSKPDVPPHLQSSSSSSSWITCILKVHWHGISKIRNPSAIPARSNVRVAPNIFKHVFTSIKQVFPAFFHNFSFPLKQMHFPKRWPAPQLRWRLKFQDIEPFLIGALRQGDRHLWRGARHVRHLGNRGEGCVRYQETKRSRESYMYV